MVQIKFVGDRKKIFVTGHEKFTRDRSVGKQVSYAEVSGGPYGFQIHKLMFRAWPMPPNRTICLRALS